MIYLSLFATLAIGFYSATNTATEIASNDGRALQASMSAESGMDFIRYQLSRVVIPHGTQQSALFTTVYNQLCGSLLGTSNFSGKSISMGDGVIHVPSANDAYLTMDSDGARFRATIENLGQKIRIKVTGVGRDDRIARAVRMDYDLAQRASAIFDYGVASRGKITTAGSSRIKGATDPTKGSVLSTCMSDPVPVMIGGKEVSGDISITNDRGLVAISGASVGGTTNIAEIYSKHVHKGVDTPEFPTIDTDAYKAYATNVYSGGGTLVNCRIPANTNPTFTAGATIKGVLYVETPNVITFRGHASIQGVIAVQNNPTGTLATNVLDFAGSVDTSGVETLPASYGDLRKLTGSFILAPNFATKFTGNFGTVNGSIIAGQISMTGNAGGTVMGSVINLDNTQMSVTGSSEVVIASTGTTNYPAGVFFSSSYAPLADTYEEVQP